MKEPYVLDESIAYYAATGRNETGEEDPSALHLILALFEGCHRLVFDAELWRNWNRTLSSLANSDMGALPRSVFTYLKLFATTQGKFELIQSAPAFSHEDMVPADDVYWVRLVVHSSAVGVTTDDKLIQILVEASSNWTNVPNIVRPETAFGNLQK